MGLDHFGGQQKVWIFFLAHPLRKAVLGFGPTTWAVSLPLASLPSQRGIRSTKETHPFALNPVLTQIN